MPQRGGLMRGKLAMTLSMLQMAAGPAGAAETREQQSASYEAYKQVVADTVSMVGDNITDMTIQVAQIDPQSEQRSLSLMPVIRYSNFEDKSADLRLKDFSILVGNEKGKGLKRLGLQKLLEDPRRYLSAPGSWPGKRSSLLAPRDRIGAGQRLFFNLNGERAPLTGKRLSDFKAEGGTGGASAKAAGEEGLNMVLLIQVPLKQKHARNFGWLSMQSASEGVSFAAATRGSSNVEAAVIGHGKVEGPFTEMAGLDIERDERYPIRVTVQFYKATSNGVVSAADMAELAGQIRRVYEQSDYVGSLVVDGPTKRRTEHDGRKEEPTGPITSRI